MASNSHPENVRLSNNKSKSVGTVKFPSDLGTDDQKPFILFKVVKAVGNRTEILDNIAMYMPQNIQSNYTIGYETIERGSEKLKSILNSDETTALSRVFKEIQSTLFTGASKEFDLKNRRVLNPHAAQKFSHVNFRTINFPFQLIAKNKKESINILEIIRLFKYYAHPGGITGVGGSVWLNMPENFQIELYSAPGVDKWLFKMKDCVLSNVSVDYGGEGNTPSFFNTGAPVNVKLDLTFQEIVQLTKNDIKDGA